MKEASGFSSAGPATAGPQTDDPIYLDHNATTPLDPRVLEAMMPWLGPEFGNAASRQHGFGRRARAAVEQARVQVAGLIGGAAEEIVWTSGATESNNLALLGLAEAYPERRHVITCAVEHKAVLDPCAQLARRGYSVTVLPVDATGRVDPAAVEAALRPDTLVVSLMAANNELGTLQPVAAVGLLCRVRDVLLHSDGAQAVGKVPLDVEAWDLDLLSISGHKVYGPKGVGALWLRGKRPRVRCRPLLFGGGHENGLRPGTLNVPGIVGLGVACELARQELGTGASHVVSLRDRLWERLRGGLPDLVRNGHPTDTLPGTLNVQFPGLAAESLLFALGEEIAMSSGSACTTASLEPSHVLLACGLSAEQSFASMRLSVGRFNTTEQVDRAAARIVQAVRALRAARPAAPPLDPALLQSIFGD